MKPLISLLQFTTILPLGKPADFEYFARYSWIYPLAGYVIGTLAAVPSVFIHDPTIGAALSVALLLLITGAHHFDGLLDLGDGLMAHGDREKRVRALTDRSVGAGGIAAGIAVTLLLFCGLQAAASIFCALVIGEVCAKFSMALLTAHGKPFREGMHSYLFQYSKPWFPVMAAMLCIPLVLLPVSLQKLLGAFAMMVICPSLLLGISKRLFGGVNGDIAGASNEITRACAVLVVVLL